MRGRATQHGLLRGSPSHASPESRSGDLPALSAFVAFEVFVEYAMKMAADDRDLVWILTSLCCKAGFSWIIFQQSRIRGCLRRERERGSNRCAAMASDNSQMQQPPTAVAADQQQGGQGALSSECQRPVTRTDTAGGRQHCTVHQSGAKVWSGCGTAEREQSQGKGSTAAATAGLLSASSLQAQKPRLEQEAW